MWKNKPLHREMLVWSQCSQSTASPAQKTGKKEKKIIATMYYFFLSLRFEQEYAFSKQLYVLSEINTAVLIKV